MLLVLLGGSLVARTEHGAPRAKGHAARKKSEVTRTFLGPNGIESTAIIAENQLPGTTAWRIPTTPVSGFIEGFANLTYASFGQTVDLYVSTSAPEFRVVAYRMGWYRGLGARRVWESREVAGVDQPPCPLTAGINMVSCDNWSLSLAVPITSAFVQGDYLLKLIGSGNQQSYVLMTIWDPSSTAPYLVVARSLTEEGWNTFGGYSYYQGEGPCTLGQTVSYPVCNRARVVSFDRPYAEGDGASDFLSNEYPLVQYMEKNGLDVAYVTDVTVDEHPAIVLNHKAYLSLGHDEVWTTAERQAVQNGLDEGVNVVFFGAAAVLRHCRLQPSPFGPDREEVDYRDPSEDPLGSTGNPLAVTGNTFSSPPTNWPETSLVGEVYSGYLEQGSAPFVVQDASAWIFDRTDLHDGSSLPGVIESDYDLLDYSSETPPNIEVLGHSPIPVSMVYTNDEWSGVTYSDMTYFTDPTSFGGVFDSGTVNWINALTPCPASPSSCSASTVGTMTGNLLRLFGQGPAGKLEPSIPNWQDLEPAGS